MAYYPVIEEEVYGPLAKEAIQPLTSGAGFSSNAFVVHMHLDGLQPILILK